MRCLRGESRPHCGERAHGSDAERADDEPAVLGKDEAAQRLRREADCFEQSEFAAALEDIPRNDDPEARAAEEHSESAEDLENREVGVLDFVEFGEALHGGDEFESAVAELTREVLAHGVHFFPRAVHEEKTGAGGVWEFRCELLLRNQHHALQYRASEAGDRTYIERLSLLVLLFNRPSQRLLQRPLQCISIHNPRHLIAADSLSADSVEHVPSEGIRVRLIELTGEREPPIHLVPTHA